MSFFEFSAKDLEVAEYPVWPAKEVAEFVVLDFQENPQTNDLKLSCKVVSERHNDRFVTMFINNKPNEFAQKRRVQFALAFWTKEELIAGNAAPAKLVNRKFSAVANAPRDWEGKVFQDWGNFKDLGEYTSASTDADLVAADGTPKF